MALGRRHESTTRESTPSGGRGGRPNTHPISPIAGHNSSNKTTMPIMNVLRYGIVLVFLLGTVYHVHWNSLSALGPQQPWTLTSQPRRMPSEGLYEAVDDVANERDWAHFAAHSPLMSTSHRQHLRQQEEHGGLPALDRIYYINLPHRPLRRAMMEGWLGNQSSPIPFHRVQPIRGTSNVKNCVSQKREPAARCYGLTSLARTMVGILRQLDVRGRTLVLEDDYQVTMPLNELVNVSLEILPDDWDVVRWDCTGGMHALANPRRLVLSTRSGRRRNVTVARTVFNDECTRRRQKQQDAGSCWFCGGTHVQMWRGSSADRLAKVWGEMPYNDVDCRLSNPDINSYCINFDGGVGRFRHEILPGEFSDVTFLEMAGHKG